MNRLRFAVAAIALAQAGCITFIKETPAPRIARDPTTGTVYLLPGTAPPTVTMLTTGNHQLIQTAAGTVIAGTDNSTGQKIGRDTIIGWKFIDAIADTWQRVSADDLEATKAGATVRRDTSIAGIEAQKEITQAGLEAEVATEAINAAAGSVVP